MVLILLFLKQKDLNILNKSTLKQNMLADEKSRRTIIYKKNTINLLIKNEYTFKRICKCYCFT